MNFSVSKKDLTKAGILLVICFLLVVFHFDLFTEKDGLKGEEVALVMAYMLLGCYIQSVKIEITRPVINGIGIITSFLVVPYMMVYIVEYLSGQSAALLAHNIFWLNYFWCMAVYLVLFVITNHYRLSMLVGSLFIYSISVMNFFVLQFRGNPLQIVDAMSFGTAADVAGNYVLSVEYELMVTGAFLFFLLSLVCIPSFHHKRREFRTIASSLILMMFIFVAGKQFYTEEVWLQNNLEMNFWNPLQGYHENGTALSLAMSGKYMFPDKPEGYKPQKAKTIVEKYTKDTPPSVKKANQVAVSETNAARQGEPVGILKEKPNVIAIMNESFADLSVQGDFETSVPYMKNFYSLKENTVRGNLSVSVFGGGTCNSEFEFLTGLTTSFLPNGAMAYQQYVYDDLHSLATIYKEQGYRPIAFHPGKPDSWRRDKVYPLLGFEEFYTKKDMKDPEYMRGAYVTDQCDYQEIIKLYEENKKKTDEKLFLFNVTIQNHGGYSLDTVGIPQWVALKGMERYPQTEQYLSIMKASDMALKELITYFEAQDEPTLIVFFGDHHPSVETEFEEELFGKPLGSLSLEEVQKRYQVPFFIWANYDIEEAHYDNVSANYLPLLTLKASGAELPPYYEYLDSLMGRVPMMNSLGYQDSLGKHHYYEDGTKEQNWIDEYKDVQYNALFDRENRKDELFEVNHSDFGKSEKTDLQSEKQ